MRHILSIALICLALVSGCSIRLGDCTIMSTKNIYCKNVDLTKLEQYPGVVGKDIRFWGIGSNIKDAADKALEQNNTNLLIDSVVYYEWFPLICGGYVVKGMCVKVPYETNSKTANPNSVTNPLGTDQKERKVKGYQTKGVDSNGKPIIVPVYK
jgi:hypothetical protein